MSIVQDSWFEHLFGSEQFVSSILVLRRKAISHKVRKKYDFFFKKVTELGVYV